jgi:DNA replication protein DnaC
MRRVEEIAAFQAETHADVTPEERALYYCACYEACIPKSFWDIDADRVSQNKAPFRNVVLKYCAKRKRALRHGYSLMFVGDNGVGKTMFMSYVLTQMIKRGSSVYYTTLMQLDIDIKRGFNDKGEAARLDQYLSSDFLAIDELGKEHFRTDSYLNARFEHLLKTRYDDGDPCILATNVDYDALVKMYGPSLASMWEGKYTTVPLAAGDFRRAAHARMKKDMAF